MAVMTHPMLNVYRAQIAGTRQIVDAALAGLDRLEHVAMKTLREAASDQFQLAETYAHGLGGSEGKGFAQLQSDIEPAAQRLARCQRDFMTAMSEMNGAVAQACNSLVNDLNDAFAQSANVLASAAPTAMQGRTAEVEGASPWAWYEGAIKQWQTLAQQAVDSSRQVAEVAEAAAVQSGRAAGKRKGG